jgi:hypothetical protein
MGRICITYRSMHGKIKFRPGAALSSGPVATLPHGRGKPRRGDAARYNQAFSEMASGRSYEAVPACSSHASALT